MKVFKTLLFALAICFPLAVVAEEIPTITYNPSGLGQFNTLKVIKQATFQKGVNVNRLNLGREGSNSDILITVPEETNGTISYSTLRTLGMGDEYSNGKKQILFPYAKLTAPSIRILGGTFKTSTGKVEKIEGVKDMSIYSENVELNNHNLDIEGRRGRVGKSLGSSGFVGLNNLQVVDFKLGNVNIKVPGGIGAIETLEWKELNFPSVGKKKVLVAKSTSEPASGTYKCGWTEQTYKEKKQECNARDGGDKWEWVETITSNCSSFCRQKNNFHYWVDKSGVMPGDPIPATTSKEEALAARCPTNPVSLLNYSIAFVPCAVPDAAEGSIEKKPVGSVVIYQKRPSGYYDKFTRACKAEVVDGFWKVTADYFVCE